MPTIATYRYGATRVRDYTPGADVLAGTVVKLADNRAGVVAADTPSGKVGSLYVDGVFDVPCASAVTAADGALAFNDVSAGNTAIFTGLESAVDYRLGPILGAKTNGQTSIRVDLNAAPGTMAP